MPLIGAAASLTRGRATFDLHFQPEARNQKDPRLL